MTDTRRVLVPVLAVALLLAGCGRPGGEASIGVREFASDVVIGGASAVPAQIPVPPMALPLGPARPGLARPPLPLPGPVVTLPPTQPDEPASGPPPTTPPAPAVPCPEGDPLATPRLNAPNDVVAPPAPAEYRYRVQGTIETGGASPRKEALPATSTRRVGDRVVAGDGSFTFSVAATLGPDTTTTTYRVVPRAAASATSPAGLSIVSVATASGVFRPVPALVLVAFPVVPGASIRSAGTDPLTGSAMSFTSTVAPAKAVVRACGIPLDTYELQLTDGRAVSPGASGDFTATYRLATQYGGLIVEDDVKASGLEGAASVARQVRATIDTEPAEPPA